MFRLVTLAMLCAGSALAQDRLPRARYDPQPRDPAWLGRVVDFHGHLGPSVVAGARMGMAGLRAVEAEGYFDVEVVCEGPFAEPPRACFLDGLQVATGATLGKRTLRWEPGERIAVRVKHSKTGKTAVLRPTPALLALLAPIESGPKLAGQVDEHRPSVEARLEAAARKIASLPEGELIVREPGR